VREKLEEKKMKKIIIISVVILPVFMLMAGCDGGYSETQNPNEQHVYVHQVNDPTYDVYLQQQMQRQSMQDFQRSTDRTMKDFDDSIRRMQQNNAGMFNILNGARQQDEMYRQQQMQQHGFGK
jgi:hypothetical protein